MIYAVRDLKENKLLNKRKGNPIFISKIQAQKLKECYISMGWEEERLKIISFELLEVGDKDE